LLKMALSTIKSINQSINQSIIWSQPSRPLSCFDIYYCNLYIHCIYAFTGCERDIYISTVINSLKCYITEFVPWSVNHIMHIYLFYDLYTTVLIL
jgi:hypothetical protein